MVFSICNHQSPVILLYSHHHNRIIPYLKHTDGTIITQQHKAWMDTPRCIMWMELVLAECGVKMLVWDSCGAHCVQAVLELFEQLCITERKLPINMTDLLQVQIFCSYIKPHTHSHTHTHTHTHTPLGIGLACEWGVEVSL